jgi:hypothetical protein
MLPLSHELPFDETLRPLIVRLAYEVEIALKEKS